MKFKIRATSRLLNDFLDATRLSAGQLLFRDREQNLDTFISRTIEDFQLSHPTHWISIEGETKSQVKFDSIRLAQVMENLLSNAVKNSPTGTGITVHLAKNKKFALVAVTDQGIGIPKTEMPKVFQMYYQVKSGQTQPQGMGLGLYLVQRILGHYKSRLKIESEEGQGTTVRFSLPIVD
jgi:signal transduction histidine kinase